jgi:TolA-binding protein
VAELIDRHFIPVKIHIKEQPATFDRFNAQWTPTFVILDPDGTERYRFEGFLPARDLLAQLEFGLGHVAFGRKQFDQAEKQFRRVVEAYPDSEAAPPALYWAGVAKYKATNDAGALAETAAAFKQRYAASDWAKKASVWAA